MAKTLADYQKAYETARAQGNADAMRTANEGAIAYRIENGLIKADQADAYRATKDIANTRAQTAANGMPAYQAEILPGTEDYSGYLRDLYAAKQEAAVAQLDAAYRKNMAELDAAGEQIAPVYQASRSAAAASSEREKRGFAEYAAANGLGSGAAGQAELARSVTLQSSLGDLDRAEANAYADLETNRAQVASEYRAAIASARAEGNEQLASALYQEAVRVDESLQKTARDQAGLNYQAYTTNYNAQQDRQERADAQAKSEYDRQMETAQLLAKYGDFSGYAALGIDTTKMKAAWEAAQKTAASGTSSKSKTSAKSSSSGSTGSKLTVAQAKALVKDGVFSDAAIRTLHENCYSDDNIRRLNSDYLKATAYDEAVAALSRLEDTGSRTSVPGRAQDLIRQYYKAGRITLEEARKLAAQYGVEF